jgi:hypothetical protein
MHTIPRTPYVYQKHVVQRSTANTHGGRGDDLRARRKERRQQLLKPHGGQPPNFAPACTSALDGKPLYSPPQIPELGAPGAGS